MPNSQYFIIFKRFLTPLRSNNKSDVRLFVVFLLLIAASSFIISLFSIGILRNELEIKAFLNNPWNKVFDLYLGDIPTPDLTEFKLYIEKLNESECCHLSNRVADYPDIITLKSLKKRIENVQVYLFDEQMQPNISRLMVGRTGDTDILGGPFIFLQKQIMALLKIKENQMVLIKLSELGHKYTTPLRAKQIKGNSRFKSFFFNDYLSSRRDKKIRLFFSDPSRGMEFLLNKLWIDRAIITPVYFGYAGKLIGAISGDQQKTSDKLLPISALENNEVYDIVNLYIYDNNDNLQVIFPLSINSINPILISETELKKKLSKIDQVSRNFFIRTDVFFKGNSQPSPFFIELDFVRNFIDSSKQERVFDFENMVDSLDIIYTPRKSPTPGVSHMLFYYNCPDKNDFSISIMNRLNSYNIRWDNGRWKTIIDLNISLKDKKRDTSILLVFNVLFFFSFLIAIFWFRLKLDFHTIGLLMSFGYSKRLINLMYLSCCFLIIVVGFFLGVLTFIFYGVFQFSNEFLWSVLAHFFTNPINFITTYFLILVITSLLGVWLIMRKLVGQKDVYGLIKYEH